MAEARFERVEAVLSPPAGDLALAAEGSRLAFDGFLRVYREGANDVGAMDGDRDRPLPALAEGQPVRIRSVRTERCRTAPPARFTEAGLVRRLEELGIGRPSTWAAIVGVLRERQYVAMAGGRFVPLARGRVATAFLERFFGPWVEYGYTAGLESDLDRVAGGRLAWKGLLSGFWGDFHPALEAAGALGRPVAIAAIDDALADFLYGAGDGARRRRCPACETGELGLKASRHGLFVGCSDWPACGYRRPPGQGSGDYTAPKPLGAAPGSGLPVTLRHGPHGWYVQKGDHAGEAKPRRMSVPGGMEAEEVTLDAALGLLGLPREVGKHPQSGEPVLAGIGRYGPWLRHGTVYAAIPDGDDVLTVGLNRAVHLLTEKEIRLSRSKGPKKVLRELGPHPEDGAPVWLLCLARHSSHYIDCLTMSGTTGPRAILNCDCMSIGRHSDPRTRHSLGGATGC